MSKFYGILLQKADMKNVSATKHYQSGAQHLLSAPNNLYHIDQINQAMLLIHWANGVAGILSKTLPSELTGHIITNIMKTPSGKIAEKAVCRSAFLTTRHCILSTELQKCTPPDCSGLGLIDFLTPLIANVVHAKFIENDLSVFERGVNFVFLLQNGILHFVFMLRQSSGIALEKRTFLKGA